jgi:hypothetical protein
MPAPDVESPRSNSSRFAAILLVVAFVAVMVTVAYFARPLDVWWLIAVGLLPSLVGFVFGIGPVLRSKPRRVMIVFHLIVYPIFAAVVFGLPAAYITFRLSDLFSG